MLTLRLAHNDCHGHGKRSALGRSAPRTVRGITRSAVGGERLDLGALASVDNTLPGEIGAGAPITSVAHPLIYRCVPNPTVVRSLEALMPHYASYDNPTSAR